MLASPARYARLGEFEGAVEVQLTAADAWMAAERNLPLAESSWVRTGGAARAEIEFDDGSVWRLGADSQGGIADYTRLSTGQRVTLISMERGLAYFSGGTQGTDSLVLVAPGAQVIFTQPVRVRLEVGSDGSRISVLEGRVRFSSPAAELDLSRGQTIRVEPENPSRFFLYREVAAMDMDRWNEARDQARTLSSAALHVNQHYGLADLDSAGEWIETENLGAVWRPKAGEGWAPFQNGRWRWYEGLGYTWVSGDEWGWPPYHYGRWTHIEKLGWVWAPEGGQAFRPGEVYWLRDAKVAGWGPLAPGEARAGAAVPRQFLNAYTTYADFAPEARVIEPAGFTGRPKDGAPVGPFMAALPSPTVDVSRLDAARPLVSAAMRVRPMVDGVAYETATVPRAVPAPVAVTVINPPPPPPVVIVQNQPPPETEVQPVLVPYPVAVYDPLTAARTASLPPAPKQQPPAAHNQAAPAPPRRSGARGAPAHGKRWQDDTEYALASEAVGHVNVPARQLQDLDTWKRRYPHSDYAAERQYYYMQAYNRLTPPRPEKVQEAAAELLKQDVWPQFDNTDEGHAQALAVLYLATASARPRDSGVGRDAATQLLRYLPVFFAPERRPDNISAELWNKARDDMEAAARRTLGGRRLAAGTR
jgi:hypothetical protein